MKYPHSIAVPRPDGASELSTAVEKYARAQGLALSGEYEDVDAIVVNGEPLSIPSRIFAVA